MTPIKAHSWHSIQRDKYPRKKTCTASSLAFVLTCDSEGLQILSNGTRGKPAENIAEAICDTNSEYLVCQSYLCFSSNDVLENLQIDMHGHQRNIDLHIPASNAANAVRQG